MSLTYRLEWGRGFLAPRCVSAKNTAVDVGFSAYHRHIVRKQKDTLRACLFVDIIFVRCCHSGRRSNLAPNFEGVGTMNETNVTLLLCTSQQKLDTKT